MYQYVKRITVIFSLLFATVSCTGTDQDKEMIQGQLIYQNNLKLPPSAQVTVQLLDTSIADKPATLVSGQTFLADGQQVPIRFKLNYETQLINAKHRYMVVADIKVKDKLIFRTAQAYMVITDPEKTKQIDLLLRRN